MQAIQQCVAHRAGWTLHVGLPTLSPLVASADVALGAAGSHSWERLAGLPAMAVAVAENQVELLAALVGEDWLNPQMLINVCEILMHLLSS